MRTTRRAPTLLALSVLLALAALLSIAGSAAAQTTVDYDMDDDGYIDVANLAQFDAIRHDVNGNGDPASTGATAYGAAFPNRVTSASGRMGCPSGTCVGYELTANLNMDTNGNGSADSGDTYWNGGKGWTPIGGLYTTDRYSGNLKGNGHTISNLFINRPSGEDASEIGLFVVIGGRIESLGITNASVTGNNFVGIIAAYNVGEIVACYTTGSVSGNSRIGGIVGHGGRTATISSSYSTASVTGQGTIGGLAGYHDASNASPPAASIINSYATGAVTRSSGTDTTIGGLIGGVASGFKATASYYDTTTSGCVSGSTTGCTTSAGGNGVAGQTTAQLQSPTDYTGIYANWNINVDDVAGVDDPWDFGASSQYPTLILHVTKDYDYDNDGYIDVANLAQLNAVRYDLNGDGAATHAEYASAFPRRETGATGRMGCPSGACSGYELTESLDLDTDGDGSADSGDDYWNSGEGWRPIGSIIVPYTGNFKGNGYAIDNMFIERSTTTYVGLFGMIGSGARVESLGITGAAVTGGTNIGILAGRVAGAVVACYSTGSVESALPDGGENVGGIAGSMRGSGASILSSYSTASANGTDAVGGLLGYFHSGTVTDTYSTGAVTRRGSDNTATTIGGLIGRAASGVSASRSYYDTTTSGCVSGGSNGCTTSAGGSGVAGRTTAQLQTPTDYGASSSDVYYGWNANLDGVMGNDDPWDFGTSSEYPTLKYGALIDYDDDDDGYIDISTLAQLNAVRYDLNGNGAPASASAAAYNTAFPNRTVRPGTLMGCPSGSCTGYELTASLDFDSDADGDVDANDHGGAYWDSGEGWVPIGASSARYTGNFKGNGHTINNLFISRSDTDDQALFGVITGRIETLGVINADVSGGSANTSILIGSNHGTVVACYTTGKASGQTYVGGLVGYSQGTITTSYSTAYATGTHIIGGLLAYLHSTGGSTVTNSYSTGRVVGTTSPIYRVGGLIGYVAPGGSVSNSYWDTISSGQSTSAGGSGVVGQDAYQLQRVTSYTGIYANWNSNLDGVMGNDDPWDFGGKMQYPMLDYKDMPTAPQGGLAMGRPDNQNTPIVGERVGVCIVPGSGATRATVSGQTHKKAWIWERSDNGDTWETITGTNPPTYEYAPTTSDTDHFLRAKVELTDGTFAITRALGGRVKNASTTTDALIGGAAITFVSGHTNPQVGTKIQAPDPRPPTGVDARFGWQRCPNTTSPHTDCEYIFGVWWNHYTPVAADVNHYLRMVVYYATPAFGWTRRATGFTGQVTAASQ